MLLGESASQPPRPAAGSGRSQGREAVAQTIARLDFLYVCDKVTTLGRIISVAKARSARLSRSHEVS